jgi:hypothetical protein
MILEFAVIRINIHTDKEIDTPVSILMSEISACYPSIDDEDCVVIWMKNGESWTLRTGYKEFKSTWETCIENISFNE